MIVEPAKEIPSTIERAIINVLQRDKKFSSLINQAGLKDVSVSSVGSGAESSLKIIFHRTLPSRGTVNNHDLNGKCY